MESGQLRPPHHRPAVSEDRRDFECFVFDPECHCSDLFSVFYSINSGLIWRISNYVMELRSGLAVAKLDDSGLSVIKSSLRLVRLNSLTAKVKAVGIGSPRCLYMQKENTTKKASISAPELNSVIFRVEAMVIFGPEVSSGLEFPMCEVAVLKGHTSEEDDGI
ncbi:hypothetical protein M569_15443 [Genlisea aurea]|uniref:Uncharacterized protein n=1 Tax=Genlisea aurea TaxID=192259 RepID=S8DIS5_9LAMI|nr:hypothetical protein M569_15443 [Genlisea aurea]